MYEADIRAKWLIINDITLKKSIAQLLGTNAYLPDGSYNRTWVASQVFGNPDLLQQLNQLVHPQVHQDAAEWIAENAQSPFLLYEAAIMQAAGKGNRFDKVVVVTAPTELRIKRIKQRDNRSEEEIINIINRQMPEYERLKMADFVIENDEKKPVLEVVLRLMEEFGKQK